MGISWTTPQKVQLPILLLCLGCAIVVIIEATFIPRSKYFVGDDNVYSEEDSFEYAIPASRNLGLACGIPILIILIPAVAGLFFPPASSKIFYNLNVVLVSIGTVELLVVWIWVAVYVNMTNELCDYCYNCPDGTSVNDCETDSYPTSCWAYSATISYCCSTYKPTLIVMFSFMIAGFTLVFVSSILSCMILNRYSADNLSVVSTTTNVTTAHVVQQPMYVQTGGVIMQTGGGMVIQQPGVMYAQQPVSTTYIVQ